jgi:hypothetical protein
MAFVILVTSVPFLQVLLKTRPLSLPQALLILTLGIAGTFWLEVRKLITYNK